MLYAGLKGACESGGMAGRIEARQAGTEREPADAPGGQGPAGGNAFLGRRHLRPFHRHFQALGGCSEGPPEVGICDCPRIAHPTGFREAAKVDAIVASVPGARARAIACRRPVTPAGRSAARRRSRAVAAPRLPSMCCGRTSNPAITWPSAGAWLLHALGTCLPSCPQGGPGQPDNTRPLVPEVLVRKAEWALVWPHLGVEV
jgi:hypothetical protein